jgi:hypothetical protein
MYLSSALEETTPDLAFLAMDSFGRLGFREALAGADFFWAVRFFVLGISEPFLGTG